MDTARELEMARTRMHGSRWCGPDSYREPTDEEIAALRFLIEHDDDEAVEVIYQLYVAQTPDERRESRTIYDNDVGFDQTDAPILSPMGWTIWMGGRPGRREMASARARLGKYARQFANYLQHGPDAVRWMRDSYKRQEA